MHVKYTIVPGEPRRIESVGYNIADTAVRRLVMDSRDQSSLRPGIFFDRNVLDGERTRITRLLQNSGYYRFSRECVNFTADTVAGSKLVGLTVNVIDALPETATEATRIPHRNYIVRNVTFVIDTDLGPASAAQTDTVYYRGSTFIYGKDRYLRPSLLDQMCSAPGILTVPTMSNAPTKPSDACRLSNSST